ncbi:hypothetical protein [Streptomyces sp. 8L]|uniref:hypothetical protein n=1 Tax=Streptomyces sp. 8L TaxID=2877242 RepID=UPI001CD5B076|nr:hypothetical protein [Streptomyces sp. 8L]MCA1220049.1 hypothetical protein [Streptomyces sp. 8L]
MPYIAPWSTETVPAYQTILTASHAGFCLGYTDEFPIVDRHHEALWIRSKLAQGIGRPILSRVHPLRQRRAIKYFLCQVCGGDTFDDDWSRWGERHLVVLPASEDCPIREGEVTTAPPLHLPCAIEAVSDCPHLRDGYSAALVGRMMSWGVAGIIHDPATLAPTTAVPDVVERLRDLAVRGLAAHRDPYIGPDLGRLDDAQGEGLALVAYSNSLFRWTIAARDAVALEDCTPVDLHELAA